MRTTLISLACLTLAWSGAASAQNAAVEAPPAPGAAIAVYSDGLSVIREGRTAVLPGGTAEILLPGLPEDLDRASLSVSVAGAPALSLALRRDRLSPDQLLARSVGQEVVWLVQVGETGAEREIRGTLVNVDGGVVLKVGERYEVMPDGRLALDHLPSGMTGGLEVTAEAEAPAGDHPVVLRYITPALSWSADYTATLSPDDSTLRLSGHYMIDNGTGIDFPAAALRLVAGETNRVDPQPQRETMARLSAAPMMAADSPATMPAPPQGAALGDVHVYDLADRADLPSDRTVRRLLLAPTAVPVEKIYRLTGTGMVSPMVRPMVPGGRGAGGGENLRPSVHLSFVNAADGPLNRALPAGPVRVFGALPDDGPDAPPVLLGADRLDHLPVGETAELTLGRAFDVTADRVVEDYETTGSDPNIHRVPYRATHAITLRNGREEAVTVEVTERFGAQSWEIVSANPDPDRRDAGAAVWTVPVPARGETVLRYSVRVRP